jgi:hypothetical protein
MHAYLPTGVAPHPGNPQRNRYRRGHLASIIQICGGNDRQGLAWLRVPQT